MDSRFHALKNTNVHELGEAYSKLDGGNAPVTRSHGTGIHISYPTAFSRGNGGARGDNQHDITILSPDKKKLETLALALNLTKLSYSFETISQVLKWILECPSTRNTSLEGVKFTIPNYHIPFYDYDCSNKDLQIIILQLLMIGVNDNGRYRRYKGWDSGFANHLATAVSAYHLFHVNGNPLIKEHLEEKKIINKHTFQQFLKRGCIIRHSEIIGLV